MSTATEQHNYVQHQLGDKSSPIVTSVNAASAQSPDLVRLADDERPQLQVDPKPAQTASTASKSTLPFLADTRYSIQYIQKLHKQGVTQPMDDLIAAWIEIQSGQYQDKKSFFYLGGLHGEPFEYRDQVDKLDPINQYTYWGGYCQHGNVLFPLWHRKYILALEEALQSAVPGVMLPFWDETQTEFDLATGKETYRGLPTAFTDTTYTFTDPKYKEKISVGDQFKDCLKAPNYTVFSNITSANAYSSSEKGHEVVALEEPHNHVHLAVGVFSASIGEGGPNPVLIPEPLAKGSSSDKTEFSGLVDGAAGDMGENNTAGLDPIFFFHHCNIDRVFWIWQKLHGATKDLPIIDNYPGTLSTDGGNGPTHGFGLFQKLTLDTPLLPWAETSGRMVTNIADLKYSYGPGSLDNVTLEPPTPNKRTVTFSGINRELFQGSFILIAWVIVKGIEYYVGHKSVLSRFNVRACSNCIGNLEVSARFSLDHLPSHITMDDLNHESTVKKLVIQFRGHQHTMTLPLDPNDKDFVPAPYTEAPKQTSLENIEDIVTNATVKSHLVASPTDVPRSAQLPAALQHSIRSTFKEQ
ncbi:putative tyrosinase [Cavenderia fasciculata]|uniref:Tyrosinase n=1 Tax=Cavenderia fasciculata TaxID=261658 RepID=F4PHR2_CACFS|nr:putative tyrosinase [Cavenderia fasciculata]EGG25246.1 putative tyrosinase [Cavenderia fasciculata]|eukprot:XP_004363097.1 putative tyrosinase [Cavenderia fasciculata]